MELIKRLLSMMANRRFGDSRRDKAALLAAYLLPLFGVIDERIFTVIAILYLPIIAYIAFSDGLYLLYPLFFFFYEQLVLPLGIVIFRVYTLAFILRFITVTAIRLWKRERVKIGVSRSVFAGFLLLTALRYAVFGGLAPLGAVLDLCFVLAFTMDMGVGEERERRFYGFMIVFVFAALTACAVGVFIPSEEGRYLATLNDPNYLGFYLNMAILTVFLHPFFRRPWIKLPALLVLYAALVASESITGVICNAAVIAFCIAVSALSGRFKLRYLVIPMICCAVAVQLVYVSQLHSWGIVTEASARVVEKLDALLLGDLSGFTTSRSGLWRINIEKYIDFNLVDALFGGALVSAVGRDAALFPQTSHQELLDALISVGAVGLTAYIALLAFILAEDAVKLRKSPDSNRFSSCIRLGIKLIWLIYAFGLTMFLNGRFFLPLLV